MDVEAKRRFKQAAKLIQDTPPASRHPVTADHNDEVSSLAYLILYVVANYGARNCAMTVKGAAEVLFYLGYQAGRQAVELDPEVWEGAGDNN